MLFYLILFLCFVVGACLALKLWLLAILLSALSLSYFAFLIGFHSTKRVRRRSAIRSAQTSYRKPLPKPFLLRRKPRHLRSS